MLPDCQLIYSLIQIHIIEVLHGGSERKELKTTFVTKTKGKDVKKSSHLRK